MSDTEKQPTAVVVTQPKRALPGKGAKMIHLSDRTMVEFGKNLQSLRLRPGGSEPFLPIYVNR